ncbi:MAG: hypothetical protein QXP82_02440 [Candidatus Aenigmatarchaeota archaeon]
MRQFFIIISIIFVIFLAGCVQKPTKSEIQFKNDVVTIENLIVDTTAPYSENKVNIEFDIQSNADRVIPQITVNFFDIPGFSEPSLDCGLNNAKIDDRICRYNQLESLDSIHVRMTLKANKVESPTPFVVSFSVEYSYNGMREAVIPVINPLIRKEPSFKFSQSEPTVGPILFEIQPLLEREKIVGDKTIKEYWAIKDQEFTTKFVLKDVGTIKNVLPINIPNGLVGLSDLINLEKGEICDFSGTSSMGIPSTKPVNKTFDTLICTFKPKSNQDEFTGIIKINYTYTYEFIRSVNFVVQPSLK